MIACLTSSPFTPGTPYLNPMNGMIERLRAAVKANCGMLFVASDPAAPDKTDRFGRDMYEAFACAGFSFSSFQVLDDRTADRAADLIAGAGLIVLAGGHVPTQNAFFQRIGLKGLLSGFSGVVLGISAGSMNSAETVYAQPEEEGEAISPAYRRFLPGLGLTMVMLLPHYQMVKDDVVDGFRVFEDVACPDSMGRKFYAIPDGSYLWSDNGQEELLGEAYRIQDGVLRQAGWENGVLGNP